MNEFIRQITMMTKLEIPKSEHGRSRVVSAFGSIVEDSEDSSFVRCYHALNNPADEKQIAEAERQLGFSIPNDYKLFLSISNGAKLFFVPRNRPRGGEPHLRYHLFDCEDLVRINRFLLQTFLDAYAYDPEYKYVRTLNYLAFCDAADDNYQAMVLEGDRAGHVFLLFHEFQCRPYSEQDADFYYTISESLEGWFDLIIRSGGWGGRGTQSGSL